MVISISKNLPFDHEAPRYRCLCSTCPVKLGAFIIAVISSVLILSNFLCRLLDLTDTSWNWELLFLIVDSLAVTSLFYGVKTEKAAFLQPFVVLSIVTIAFLVLLVVFFGSAVYDSRSYAAEYLELSIKERSQVVAEWLSVDQKNVVPMLAGFAAVGLGLAAIIHCYCLHVVVQCAQYFRDLEPIKASMRSGYSPDLTDPRMFGLQSTAVVVTSDIKEEHED